MDAQYAVPGRAFRGAISERAIPLRRDVYCVNPEGHILTLQFPRDFESLKSRMPHLGAAFEGW